MPSLGSLWRDITGRTGADAAGQAAGVQTAALEDLMRRLEPLFAGARTNVKALYGQAETDVNTGFDTARGDVTAGFGRARETVPMYFDQASGEYQPYAEAGAGALERLQDPTAFETSPGYAFRLAQGEEAIQRASGVSGSPYGGRTLKALQDYAQNTASAEYGNWWNRQAGLAGMGLTAASGRAGLSSRAGELLAGIDTGEAGALATLSSGRGTALAGLRTGQAGQETALTTSWADALASIIGGQANARAAGITGGAEARARGAQNLINIGGITGGVIAGLSDARLKDNVRTLDGAAALALLGQVRFCTWDWKDVLCDEPEVGVIAQELQRVAPELVKRGPDGYLRVDYHTLFIYGLAALQELALPTRPFTTGEAVAVNQARAERNGGAHAAH